MRRLPRKRRWLLLGFAAALVICLAPNAGAAPAGASDTATPVYVSSTSASSVNKFDCSAFAPCKMVATTKLTAYPCTNEVIALSGAGTPALLYPNTYCAVRIEGDFYSTSEYYLGQTTGPCAFDPTSVRVSFTSGANSAFNGSFDALATFKPTSVDATTRNVRSAVITVKGGSQFPYPGAGRGAINASFNVAFNSTGFRGVGLDAYCYHSSAVGLTTVANGSLSVSF